MEGLPLPHRTLEALVNPSSSRSWRSALLLLAALVGLSVIAIEPPPEKGELAAGGGGGQGEVLSEDGTPLAPGEITEDGTSTPGDPTAPGQGPTAGPGSDPTKTQSGGSGGRVLECKAGRNGGSTDKGVSAGRIKLAATNVRSGTGASFLGTSYVGMQAVVNRVNAAGGICGRLLDLRLVDDGWDPQRGQGYLQNFAKEDYFALPVVPSSEGLTQAIKTGVISGAGIPVVGTDGMLKEQYAEPWVWPVATSTVTTMRVMAKHAYDTGARTFGIVYDRQYKFGVEGQKAFAEYIGTLGGATLKASVPLTPKQPNYSSEAKQFNDACGAGGCQFVAMLLTPETAATYISSQPEQNGRRLGFGTMQTGGAQPLFNERFARDCGRPCDGMYVWTGYNPPIGRLSSLKDVAAYVDDVRSVDPGVDVNNQFLEGAYLGMKVFVAALEKAGPKLTRAAVRDAMNTTPYTSDLASPLSWSPSLRFANQTAQAFRIVTSSGSFAGFAEAGTGFLKDPTPGVVPKD